MTDSRSGEKSLREVDLNINLYLTLNCGTASEHLKYSNKIKLENKLYDVFVAFVGLNIRKNSICRISDLDQSCLPDTRSGRKCQYRSDTDSEYPIGAPHVTCWQFMFHTYIIKNKKNHNIIFIQILLRRKQIRKRCHCCEPTITQNMKSFGSNLSMTDLNQPRYWHKITLHKILSKCCQNPPKY